jgi:hypothetical protein
MSLRTLLSLAVAAGLAATSPPAAAVDPGSQPIGCDRADTLVTLTQSSHLDPSCTWTRGIEIVASDVVFDCQGARIAPTTSRQRGILITAPTTVALSNIVVRNCVVEGFLNNVRITREGFRDLPAGAEYDNAFSDIVIEDSTLLDSRGSGLFVDGYVTGVTLRRLRIEGSGSVGIYLEAGSKDNVVEDNDILDNGYGENSPSGQFFEFGGFTFWFWGTGREGLAIDGSRNNRVVGNRFAGNAAGAILLYKNCGEFVNQRPDRWWVRRYGADGNLIEGNTITGGRNGVWIGSRMGENTLPMDCSDPQYLPGIALDYAADNVVRGNAFQDVTYGVRVEDDRARIEGNTFTGADPAAQAVVVGTPYRTSALDRPVDGSVVTGNQADIAGNPNPYRWVHGQVNTTFTGNHSLGRLVGFCEGVPPARGPFVMAVAVVPAEPGVPPEGDPPVLPPPDPLPPCPLACTASTAIGKPRLRIGRLHTPPGDDTFTFRGRLALPVPVASPLDPTTVGVGVLVRDALGAPVIDVTVPAGAFDPATGVGWKTSARRDAWTYANRSAAPPAGIIAVRIRNRSTVAPGLVDVAVKGRRGAYPVDASRLPLNAVLVLDPPTAETGQCGQAAFGASDCRAGVRTARCG